MQSPKDQRILSSMDPNAPISNDTIGYGLILRFGLHAWKGSHWKTHQRTMQANALLLKLLESHTPTYISRSTVGCEAVFLESARVLQAAIQLHTYMCTRKIPACIVLYKDEGYLEEQVWISAQERRAECVAFQGQQHDLLIFDNIKNTLALPIGVGMLPASKTLQTYIKEPLWNLHVYQNDE